MLQQTQVKRVLKKYPEFLRAFPDFKTLTRAPLPRILRVWQGMGYNRRALQLKKLAALVVKKYGGILPPDPEKLQELPGIGKATVGAMLAFAFNKPVPFIETNIRRTYIHHFFPRRKKVTDAEILKLVEKTLDRKNPRACPPKSAPGGRWREWYWALMDYGAMLGRQRKNPNVRSAHYAKQSPFHGSNRELRGKIVKLLTVRRVLSPAQMQRLLSESATRLRAALRELKNEGFTKTQQKEKTMLKT
jgi:A/G-specific adenine glycosylase